MLTQRYGVFLVFMLTTISFKYAVGQCTANPKSSGPKFPDPKSLFEKGVEYEIKVEVSDIQNMHSMYATEYYQEAVDYNGRVDGHFNGIQTSFLYRSEFQETFTFKKDELSCKSENITEDVKPPYEEFNVYDWKYKNGSSFKFGPFSMLYKGYEARSAMEYKGSTVVRGLDAKVWKRCAEENKLTIYYMMIDEDQSMNTYGLKNKPIPLRITVEGTLGNIIYNQSYEFVHFQLNIEDHDVLSIPVGRGCKRLVEPEKKMNHQSYNLAYEAEIVYTAHYRKDRHIYINNLKVVYHNTSGLFAYTTIPWIAHNDSKFADAKDELFRVYDGINGYLYEQDLDGSSCNISATTAENSGANLYLPNGKPISLLDPYIIAINRDTAEDFIYLGKGKVRGKDVDIFERTWDNAGLEIFVSTHYYLAEHELVVFESEERKPLMKVVYTTSFVEDLLNQEVVFNFYLFNTALTHKPKHFDVSSCFTEENQTEWFQVYFYIDSTETKELEDAFPKIQDQFFSYLALNNLVTPVRIPRITMHVDAYYLYITAALLERVPAKLDFQFQDNVRVNEPDFMAGIATEDGCFQSCIENRKCIGINYCGVNCGHLYKTHSGDALTKDKGCALYNKVKNSTQLTIKQINKKINERIETADFKLKYINKDGVVKTLENPQFQNGVAFGLKNYKGDGARYKIGNDFTIYKQGIKINTQASSSKISFAECQKECLSDSNCESLSFCEFTFTCVLSKFHGEDLDEKSLAKDDKCITLNRNYMYLFNEYPGVSISKKAEVELQYNTAETCAKACVNTKDISCRSFDLCDGDQRMCLLHSTHVLDSKGEDVKSSNCEHFSRKYFLDFEKQEGKAVLEDGAQEKVMNLQTEEECAKLCVENSECKSFDFCRKPFKSDSQCYISMVLPSSSQIKVDASCNLYFKSSEKTAKLLSPVKMETMEHVHHTENFLADDDGKEKNVKVVEVIEDTGYSKSLTGGIAFFLFLVGIAIGAAAMFGYGYYKANRKE